jgi:hypothetical protein
VNHSSRVGQASRLSPSLKQSATAGKLVPSFLPPRLCAAAMIALLFVSVGFAQYAIDWHAIDGGGGTSTGGGYSLSGTIGQPDAGGPMTGGQYAITGGFWALPTEVQSSNAPTLLIVRAAPGLATISWTPNTPGFVLQEAPSLSPANWVNSPSGAANPVTVSAALPKKFYRLKK